jgi:hypothetical protein
MELPFKFGKDCIPPEAALQSPLDVLDFVDSLWITVDNSKKEAAKVMINFRRFSSAKIPDE